MDAQLKRGLLEVCVLASACREGSYGYKMIKDMSPYIEISESTLYPILKRMESGEYMTTYTKEHNGRLRKYYQITDAGREKIKEFISEFDTINQIYSYIKGELDNDTQ